MSGYGIAHVAARERILAGRTAMTAEASTVPEPHGKPGGGLWGVKGLKAPPYIEHVAGELMKQGRDESSAYHEAVGIVENWAAGHDGHGNRVHPDVQAAAGKNIADWERLRATRNQGKRPDVAERMESEPGGRRWPITSRTAM